MCTCQLAFKELWTTGTTNPTSLFQGRTFTQAPDHKTIDVRMLPDFVPRLLPPTEAVDEVMNQLEFDIFENPDPFALLRLILDTVLPNVRAPDSPLGFVVPRLEKHRDAVATPFRPGQLAHHQGRLCRIDRTIWESDVQREEGRYPDQVVVCWIETDEIPTAAVVSPDGSVIPAVAGFQVHSLTALAKQWSYVTHATN